MWSSASALGEALDLLFHVGVDQALEVVDQAVGAAVELLVEALDGVLVEDVGVAPTRSWGSAGVTSQLQRSTSLH